MSDQNISHTSSDNKADQVKGNLLVAGVSVLAASALIFATWAGLS